MTKEKRWRDIWPVHPAAELFPLMSEAELRDFADDIEKNGLKELVDLYDDPKLGRCLLDGRNRLDALELMGWQEDENQRHSCELPSKGLPLGWGLGRLVESNVDPYAHVISK